MIIALDGSDGSGKSTVVNLLYDYLTIDKPRHGGGSNVYRVNHPGATAVGKELRRIVKDPKFEPIPMVARLIFAADTLQFEHEYGPLSEAGAIVICDRFSRITDLVYGAADGMELDKIAAVQDMVGQKLKADYYFVLQCPAEVSLDRKEKRAESVPKGTYGSVESERCRIEEKGRQHAQRIAEKFNSLVTRDNPGFPTQYLGAPNFSHLQALAEGRADRIFTVNANQTAREILNAILTVLGFK